jgi:hypothetical protein
VAPRWVAVASAGGGATAEVDLNQRALHGDLGELRQALEESGS